MKTAQCRLRGEQRPIDYTTAFRSKWFTVPGAWAVAAMLSKAHSRTGCDVFLAEIVRLSAWKWKDRMPRNSATRIHHERAK